MLCVRVWAGVDPPSVIIPEGRDDVERRSAAGSTLVQIKSRREHLGDLPLADARDFIKTLWERPRQGRAGGDGAGARAGAPCLSTTPRRSTASSASAPSSRTCSPAETRVAGLLAKTVARHAPEPAEAAIAIIVQRTGCSRWPPRSASRGSSRSAESSPTRRPAEARRLPGMSASDTDAAVTDMLSAVDVAQVEAANRRWRGRTRRLSDPDRRSDFYLGVDVQPGARGRRPSRAQGRRPRRARG